MIISSNRVPGPYPDLTIHDSRIVNNGKIGIYVHNLQSLVNVTHSDVNENGYGGIRVRDGAGHVNVTFCNVNYNKGDGIRVNTAGEWSRQSQLVQCQQQGLGGWHPPQHNR